MIGRVSSLVCLVLALGAAAIPSNTDITTAASTKRMFGNANIAPPPHVDGPRFTASATKRMFGSSNITPPPHVDGPRFNGTSVAARDTHELSTRDVVSFPRWVVYSDSWVSGESGPPAASSLKGFNTFIMSFYMSDRGPVDQALEWVNIGAAAQQSIKASYNAAGIKLMVSAFGSSDAPTSLNKDPIAMANTIGQWVLDNHLDGVDVDYEDFVAVNLQNGVAENWLINFTKQLRVKLPVGQYIVTHAPVAPWMNGALYKTGAYWAVHLAVGSLVDWWNIQFYNQGMYTDCNGLLTQSASPFPNSALFQLASAGWVLDKLVIGKPAALGNANNGYIVPNDLAACIGQAKARGWNGGVMSWQFPDANAAWVQSVRSQSWPV